MYFLFDTETTGLRYDYHEICSLAAILLDDNLQFIAKGYMKLMPKHWERAEKEALAINGISPETWEPTHKSNSESIKKMYDFIHKHNPKGEKIWPMGHNVSFDLNHLKALINNEGMSWIFHYNSLDTIDMMLTWSLATGEKIKDMRLIKCCEVFNIKNDKAHDAMGDVVATMQLAQSIIDDLRFRIKNGTKGIV